jgi:undecaprenyl-diphosphatase
VTILGGRAARLSTGAAVEFSFLLGAITLLAASGYEAMGNIDSIWSTIGVGPALMGFVVATVAAAFAARWLVAYLSRHSLAVFGWYRVILGGVTLLLLT